MASAEVQELIKAAASASALAVKTELAASVVEAISIAKQADIKATKALEIAESV